MSFLPATSTRGRARYERSAPAPHSCVEDNAAATLEGFLISFTPTKARGT